MMLDLSISSIKLTCPSLVAEAQSAGSGGHTVSVFRALVQTSLHGALGLQPVVHTHTASLGIARTGITAPMGITLGLAELTQVAGGALTLAPRSAFSLAATHLATIVAMVTGVAHAGAAGRAGALTATRTVSVARGVAVIAHVIYVTRARSQFSACPVAGAGDRAATLVLTIGAHVP
jgi:hypothetical protein